MSFETDPLSGPLATEVPLARPPLVRVLAQIRFADVLKIKDAGFIADFQERLREEYPDFKEEQTTSVAMGPEGPEKIDRDKVWRFINTDGKWTASLSRSFIALETRDYQSRSDFLERLQQVTAGVNECFRPAFTRRVGVRYIDRVEGPEFERLDDLIRDRMLGIVKSDLHEHIKHTMSQAVFSSPEGGLNARWGIVPANQTHDTSIPAVDDGDSWILDVDAFRDLSDRRFEFDAAELTEIAYQLAARAYTFFRWSVTDAFLDTYGRQS